MAITEMNFASGGATSADKVSYIESDGTKTDLQTKVSEVNDKANNLTKIYTQSVHVSRGDAVFTRIGDVCYLNFSSGANSIPNGWNYGVVPSSQIPKGYKQSNPTVYLLQMGMSNAVILQGMIDDTNGFSIYNPSGAVQYASVFVQYIAEEDLPI